MMLQLLKMIFKLYLLILKVIYGLEHFKNSS